jgi:COP9 signalosome complex subunit 1
VEALKLAIREAKTGKDIKLYLDLQNTLEILAPGEPEAQRDQKWMERTEKQNAGRAQTLEAEVKEYKTNLVKESVRVSFLVYQILGADDRRRWAMKT